MKYFNYRFNYDNGSSTEFLKVNDKIDIERILKEPTCFFNIENHKMSIAINTSHIINIERWETEEDK